MIRKPDNTKNMSTPRYPPGALRVKKWKPTTETTATARMPSSDGS